MKVASFTKHLQQHASLCHSLFLPGTYTLQQSESGLAFFKMHCCNRIVIAYFIWSLECHNRIIGPFFKIYYRYRITIAHFFKFYSPKIGKSDRFSKIYYRNRIIIAHFLLSMPTYALKGPYFQISFFAIVLQINSEWFSNL